MHCLKMAGGLLLGLLLSVYAVASAPVHDEAANGKQTPILERALHIQSSAIKTVSSLADVPPVSRISSETSIVRPRPEYKTVAMEWGVGYEAVDGRRFFARPTLILPNVDGSGGALVFSLLFVLSALICLRNNKLMR